MNWRNGIGIGITCAVLAVLIGAGVKNGTMMNLHGGALGDASNVANIEPAAGVDDYAADTALKTGCGLKMEWIGHKVNVKALKQTEHSFRILPPNSMMTMDHIPTRMNIQVDRDGVVTNVECG